MEQLDHFFDTNEIVDVGKKKSVFWAVVGPTTYALLRSLVSPARPGDKTFAELVAALKEHFKPTPSETVQCSKFHTRVRKPGESVADFVAELRSLAEFCNFGASLNDMLRDRIVCGINSSKIQQRLLAEKDLTLEKAVNLAQGMETATKNVQELAQTGSVAVAIKAEVNQVTPYRRSRKEGQQTRKFTGTCFCCGKLRHRREDCRHKDAMCHICHKKGHLRTVCRSSTQTTKQKYEKYTKLRMTTKRRAQGRTSMKFGPLTPPRRRSRIQ